MQTTDSTPAPDTVRTVAPLFRKQAVAHMQMRSYGTVMLFRPISHTWLCAAFGAIMIALIAFFAFFSTVRKAPAQGLLVPAAGVIRVTSLQPGILARALVKEGQSVIRGQPLFVLSNERSSSYSGATQEANSHLLGNRRDSYKAEVKQSKEQAEKRTAALRRRAADFLADSVRLRQQMELQRKRVLLVESELQRYRELQNANYISSVQLEAKHMELLDQQQRLADLDRLIQAAERDARAAQAEADDVHLQSERDQAAVMRNVAALEQDINESEARREILVRAAQAGTVTAITAEPGQALQAGQAMASILPADSELEAEIYVPSRSVGFIKPGMKVMLRYQAYPYQKFGQFAATVNDVASTALKTEDFARPLPQLSNGEPVYRIRLKLNTQSVRAYGQQMPLKSGMLVDASIMLEHRRLYEWVLDPLFSISGRL